MLKPGLAKNRILSDKERKNLAILEVIRKDGPISRTDISKVTEFNIVTVSNYVNHYIKKGLVVEGELDESTGGRKPVLVELNAKAAYVIGIGLNLLNVVGVLVDLETNVIYETRRERVPENTEKVVELLTDIASEIIEKSGVDSAKLCGVGVAVPGVIDEKGRTVRWPGLLGTKDVSVCISIKDIFEQKFKVPCYVENDANAAVLGEKWLGLDRDVRHMLYMFSGIGCGIMIDGEIYRGASGASGELGIYSADPDHQDMVRAQEEGIGRWELELGMLGKAREIIKNGSPSKLKDLVNGKPEDLRMKHIIESVKSNDPTTIKLVESCGYALGKKIAFLINLLNPEVVIIGGGIEDCGATMLDSVKEAVKVWAVEEAGNNVKIIPSAFGDKAVAFGVVGIVERELFAQA